MVGQFSTPINILPGINVFTHIRRLNYIAPAALNRNFTRERSVRFC
jgi:hypothetical protein